MSRDAAYEVGPRLGKTIILVVGMILLFIFVIMTAKI
jgi:hypothetical protein